MKKITLLLVATLFLGASNSFGQATRQLSFGVVGVAYDIPVAAAISIAPFASTNWDFNHLVLGVKGDYYFDTLLGLPAPWDVYAGANAGFAIGLGDGNSSDLDIGLQVGGRWFWNEKWGLFLQGGGGMQGATGGLGITMKL
jgi:hypothetical protein